MLIFGFLDQPNSSSSFQISATLLSFSLFFNYVLDLVPPLWADAVIAPPNILKPPPPEPPSAQAGELPEDRDYCHIWYLSKYLLSCLKKVKFDFLLNHWYFYKYFWLSICSTSARPVLSIFLNYLKTELSDYFLTVEFSTFAILLSMISFYMMVNNIFWKTHVFNFTIRTNRIEWKDSKDFFFCKFTVLKNLYWWVHSIH